MSQFFQKNCRCSYLLTHGVPKFSKYDAEKCKYRIYNRLIIRRRGLIAGLRHVWRIAAPSLVDASDLATACILSRFSDRSRIPVAYIVDRRWVAVLEAAELPNSIRLASLLPVNSGRRPMPFVVIVIIFISIYQAGSDVNNKNNNRKLNYKHLIRYDTIRDAILTCARKPTWVGLIYRTETTTKNCKTGKTKK